MMLLASYSNYNLFYSPRSPTLPSPMRNTQTAIEVHLRNCYTIYDTNVGKPIVKNYIPALQCSLYRHIVNLIIQESQFTNNDLYLEGMHECVQEFCL
jgi:hypothetical protein